MTFAPEFDRNNQPGPSNPSPNAYASDIESALIQTTKLLNVSLISNDGNIVETEITEIENETPIYEVFEQPFTIPTSPVHETNHDNELNESNNLSNVNLELAEELIRMAEKRENTFEKTFKERVLLKIESDLKNRFYKQSAAKFLHETFGAEMLHDDNFLSWLVKRLDYKTYRLRNILSSYEQQIKSCRSTLSVSQHQKIYDFWLDENVSIPSTDRRSGRHEVRIGKLQYIKELKHLEHISDENCKEKGVTLKNTG